MNDNEPPIKLNTGYDEALFLQSLRKSAKNGKVSRSDLCLAFWDCSPELLQSIKQHRPDLSMEDVNKVFTEMFLPRLYWILRKENLTLD